MNEKPNDTASLYQFACTPEERLGRLVLACRTLTVGCNPAEQGFFDRVRSVTLNLIPGRIADHPIESARPGAIDELVSVIECIRLDNIHSGQVRQLEFRVRQIRWVDVVEHRQEQ